MGRMRMSLFNFRKPPQSQPAPEPTTLIPVSQIDLSKRYDVYYLASNEERVYENIKFVGMRTFDRVTEPPFVLSGYLEIETADGARMMLPTFGIQLLCEHGTKTAYKVVRRWFNRAEY